MRLPASRRVDVFRSGTLGGACRRGAPRDPCAWGRGLLRHATTDEGGKRRAASEPLDRRILTRFARARAGGTAYRITHAGRQRKQAARVHARGNKIVEQRGRPRRPTSDRRRHTGGQDRGIQVRMRLAVRDHGAGFRRGPDPRQATTSASAAGGSTSSRDRRRVGHRTRPDDGVAGGGAQLIVTLHKEGRRSMGRLPAGFFRIEPRLAGTFSAPREAEGRKLPQSCIRARARLTRPEQVGTVSLDPGSLRREEVCAARSWWQRQSAWLCLHPKSRWRIPSRRTSSPRLLPVRSTDSPQFTGLEERPPWAIPHATHCKRRTESMTSGLWPIRPPAGCVRTAVAAYVKRVLESRVHLPDLFHTGCVTSRREPGRTRSTTPSSSSSPGRRMPSRTDCS